MNNKYSVSDNVRNWLWICPWVILLGFLPLGELPEICWFHGIAVGAMGVWAMNILDHWVRIKQNEEENKN